MCILAMFPCLMCIVWQAVDQAHKHGVVLEDFNLENFKLLRPLALSHPVFVAIDLNYASANAERIAADKRKYTTFDQLVSIFEQMQVCLASSWKIVHSLFVCFLQSFGT